MSSIIGSITKASRRLVTSYSHSFKTSDRSGKLILALVPLIAVCVACGRLYDPSGAEVSTYCY